MTSADDSTNKSDSQSTPDFALERYRYILQQIHAINENVHKFLTLFQTLTSAIVAAALALFVGHRKWEISRETAQVGVVGLLALQAIVALMAIILVYSGLLSWLDYRREEYALSEKYFEHGFREPPELRNFYRWYETYILLFIILITCFLWIMTVGFVMPRME